MAQLTMKGIEYHIRKQPLNNSVFCGDTAMFRQEGSVACFAVADVLGHGREAHQLAEKIDDYLLSADFSNPEKLMEKMHRHILGSRGAVVALCRLHTETGRFEYIIMGNITLRLFGSYDTRIVPKEGIVGYVIRNTRCKQLDLDEQTTILLHTDGVSDRFNRKDYPDILTDPPDTVTATIIEKYAKGHDDALCMALKYHKESI